MGRDHQHAPPIRKENLLKVWKYNFELVSEQFIELPTGAFPIHFATQGNCICVWMEVDPNAEKERREIRCIPTGFEDIPDNMMHLGTVVLPNDDVYHYYW